MAKFKPLPTGAVHTMETITERCEEEGECLIWQAGKSHGTPALRHGDRTVQVRRYIFEVLQGKKVPKGMLISFCCDNIDCVHPEHIRMFTRKQLQARTVKRTQYGANPVRSLRLAKAAQARSDMTWDRVREIRAMDGTDKGIARELELPFSVVNSIRKHRTWKEASPFAALLTN